MVDEIIERYGDRMGYSESEMEKAQWKQTLDKKPQTAFCDLKKMNTIKMEIPNLYSHKKGVEKGL